MYQIRRGWPSNAAIDEVFEAQPGQVIAEGHIVSLANGKATVASYTAAAAPADPVTAFVIGTEKVRGKLTGLLSQCIIEVDSTHYATGAYSANDPLTAVDGKFSKVTAVKEKVLGRVLAYDATNGMLRVLWHAAV